MISYITELCESEGRESPAWQELNKFLIMPIVPKKFLELTKPVSVN